MNLDLIVALVTITVLLFIIAGELHSVSSSAAECLKVLEEIRDRATRDR